SYGNSSIDSRRKLNGISEQPYTTSYANQILLIFSSERYFRGKEFLLHWEQILDCSSYYYQYDGKFSYPQRRNNYYQVTEERCWMFDFSYVIEIDFLKFDLQYGDYLIIRDGDSIRSPIIGNFSAANIPTQPVIINTELFFHFLSPDYDRSTSQFEFDWKRRTDPICGEIFNESLGYIDFPTNYMDFSDNIYCHWTIITTPGLSIVITVIDFESDYYYDKLEI
ncbi:unnamed protein product, partial [Meganyctiphanes norvegica]